MATKKEKNFKHYFSTIYSDPRKKHGIKKINGKKVLDIAIAEIEEKLKKEKENDKASDSDNG
jgi:hypothetical protein